MVFTVETEKKLYRVRALDMNILVVASVTKGVGAWSAYIGTVFGVNHKVEFLEIVDWGSKVDEGLAKHLFPEIALKYTWRI